jgi:uncharacterized membrane protein
MGGYTVFLGPITGIMITDVGPHLKKVLNLIVALGLSIGLYTARTSMFLRCINHMESIGIHMEL